MIVNPFYFEENSVNDGTEKHWCSVKYPSVDEAVQFVLALAEMHGATKKLERLL